MRKSKFAPNTSRFNVGNKFFWYDHEGTMLTETITKIVHKAHPGDNELHVEEGLGWLPEHMAKPMEGEE